MRPAPLLAERTADRLWEATSDALHEAARAERAALEGQRDGHLVPRPAFAAALTWTIPPRSALPERPAGPRGQLEIPGAG